ncbi:hypothetical protein FRACA_530028 [Frankia canadensis]|uniref:Uncharacterized protein n=1 Tax=Frankia canadensis TaxID=1836972 RepID=A0A2I2KYR5_9ACTN|nr:hypothetical protein FRACA_530028 [Frankia canadensis]SOU58095.1 hypothetical protein FRACA_530028 [Frankia canadensis]
MLWAPAGTPAPPTRSYSHLEAERGSARLHRVFETLTVLAETTNSALAVSYGNCKRSTSELLPSSVIHAIHPGVRPSDRPVHCVDPEA